MSLLRICEVKCWTCWRWSRGSHKWKQRPFEKTSKVGQGPEVLSFKPIVVVDKQFQHLRACGLPRSAATERASTKTFSCRRCRMACWLWGNRLKGSGVMWQRRTHIFSPEPMQDNPPITRVSTTLWQVNLLFQKLVPCCRLTRSNASSIPKTIRMSQSHVTIHYISRIAMAGRNDVEIIVRDLVHVGTTEVAHAIKGMRIQRRRVVCP